MKLLKVSLQTHLKTLIPRTPCKYSQPLHFPRTSSPTTVHLCAPFSAREKNIRALWFTFLLRSILGDGGGMETSEGLYFQRNLGVLKAGIHWLGRNQNRRTGVFFS